MMDQGLGVLGWERTAGEEKRKWQANRGTKITAWILSGLLRSEEVGGAEEMRGVGM